MKTTDLHDLLAARAEAAAEPATIIDTRIRGAVRKARAIRRRRRVVGGAVATAAVAALAGLAAPLMLTADGPDPAGPAEPMAESTPLYAHGGVLIGEVALDLPATSASTVITPEDFPLTFAMECTNVLANDPSRPVHRVRIEINSATVWDGTCGTAIIPRGGVPTPGSLSDPAFWSAHGVEARQPATVTVSLVEGSAGVSLSETGGVALAIYQHVQWDDYAWEDNQFPPRPDVLQELDSSWTHGGPEQGIVGNIESYATDVNVPQSIVVETGADDFMVKVSVVTPGIVRIFANDVEIGREEFFDYSAGSYHSGLVRESYESITGQVLHPGEPVRIDLMPAHLTGAWRADIAECDVWEGGHFCPSSPN